GEGADGPVARQPRDIRRGDPAGARLEPGDPVGAVGDDPVPMRPRRLVPEREHRLHEGHPTILTPPTVVASATPGRSATRRPSAATAVRGAIGERRMRTWGHPTFRGAP